MSAPIITLTTDWGDGDFFAGMFKGRLMSIVEDVRIVDITHRIEPMNVGQATFVVRQACMGFPPGTVHIIDVASRPPFLVVKARGQYFICCDNGLPAMAFGDSIEDISLLQVDADGFLNFAAYTIFAGAAAMLLGGASMRDLGEHPGQILQRNLPRFMQQGDHYIVYVHHIDSYGNAYLGMTYREFEELRAGRAFVLSVRDQEVTELMSSYFQQHTAADPRRRLRLTVSATGLLELAIKDSSLISLLGIKVNESVLLRFKD